MKIITIDSESIIINVNKQLFFTLFTEWVQLDFRRVWNWMTITPIHIFFEWDKMCHGYVFQVVILGFGFSCRYNTKKALELFEKFDEEGISATSLLDKLKED